MKKLILPLLVVIVSVFSCKKTEQKSTEITKKAVEVVSKKKETTPSKVNETKEEFLGSDGNRYVVTYAFEKNQPIAIVTSNDFSTTLNQEQAWAKGAEYKNENYKLVSKEGNVSLFINDKEVTLTSNDVTQNFKGNDGKEYTVKYTSKNDKRVAVLTSNDFTKTLNQTEAWAKGAEYRSEDYKLISKGDNVQLFVKDKEIKLSPIK